MLRLNKYIFITVCVKELDKYNEIMDSIRKDYFNILNEIIHETKCSEIRKIAHKLLSVVSLLKGTNTEALYILKSLLSIDKSITELNAYKYYINLLEKINTDNMF